MAVKSISIVIGNSLVCSVPNEDWHFFIRRLDGENDVVFSTFHRKNFGAKDVEKFIPHWKTVRWVKIKNSQLGHSESYTKDTEFEINVYAAPDSEKKHPDVIKAFLDFMNEK
ncbi:MAG: hypothetical protein WBI40_01545 [Methylococcaceae bacterium]